MAPGRALQSRSRVTEEGRGGVGTSCWFSCSDQPFGGKGLLKESFKRVSRTKDAALSNLKKWGVKSGPLRILFLKD